MRAALILAVFLTLAVIAAIVAARRFVAAAERRRREEASRRAVGELEAENQELDRLLQRERDRDTVFRDRGAA